jgi:hypothetical protein
MITANLELIENLSLPLTNGNCTNLNVRKNTRNLTETISVNEKSTVFLELTPWSPVEVNQCFGEMHCLQSSESKSKPINIVTCRPIARQRLG